jgi:hypothetical protein
MADDKRRRDYWQVLVLEGLIIAALYVLGRAFA